MSRAKPNRSKRERELDEAMRKASAQGVLFSQLVARRLRITSTDLECLDVISLRGPVTAGELAAVTGLTTGAVTGVIDRLERSGFARRERDKRDRRKVRVRALPAAERNIAPLFAPMQRAIRAAVAGYGENELAILIDFFTRHHKEAVAATAELQTVRPGRGSETAAGPAKAATQFDKSSPSGRHRRPRLGSPGPE
jgi:DNA-binding MarR family transcriptional regulator